MWSGGELFIGLASAGDITQKGYEKKRARILAPYLNVAGRYGGVSGVGSLSCAFSRK